MKLLLPLVCLICLSSTALAQTDEELQLAAKHYEEGASHYNGGKYAEAITAFQRAFQVVPNALFLYNISLAQGRLGLFDDAMKTGVKATEYEGMDEATSTRNDSRIGAYAIQLQATKITENLAAVAAETEIEIEEPEPRPPEKSKFGALGYTGIGLTVVGGGLLAVSGVMANKVSDGLPAYREAGEAGDSEDYRERQDDLKAQQNLGLITLGAGSLLAATGVTLILIDLFNDTESGGAFISPTKDGVSVGWQNRF